MRGCGVLWGHGVGDRGTRGRSGPLPRQLAPSSRKRRAGSPFRPQKGNGVPGLEHLGVAWGGRGPWGVMECPQGVTEHPPSPWSLGHHGASSLLVGRRGVTERPLSPRCPGRHGAASVPVVPVVSQPVPKVSRSILCPCGLRGVIPRGCLQGSIAPRGHPNPRGATPIPIQSHLPAAPSPDSWYPGRGCSTHRGHPALIGGNPFPAGNPMSQRANPVSPRGHRFPIEATPFPTGGTHSLL